MKKVIVSLSLLWLVSCQKETNNASKLQTSTINDVPVIEYRDEYSGGRSGLAPFLNLSVLALDSTQVVSNPTQVQFNGARIARITATPSGGIGANYLGVSYNHYLNCTITFSDGSEWKHGKPIYISHQVSGNLILSGPLTSWSSLKADHPSNMVRYARTTSYRNGWLPMIGKDGKVYTYIVNGRRIELYPTNKAYSVWRAF